MFEKNTSLIKPNFKWQYTQRITVDSPLFNIWIVKINYKGRKVKRE